MAVAIRAWFTRLELGEGHMTAESEDRTRYLKETRHSLSQQFRRNEIGPRLSKFEKCKAMSCRRLSKWPAEKARGAALSRRTQSGTLKREKSVSRPAPVSGASARQFQLCLKH